VKELGDKAAQGRACGNLGNTHYLLGNFKLAIRYHEEGGNVCYQGYHKHDLVQLYPQALSLIVGFLCNVDRKHKFKNYYEL
jgi:hypothetical protein